MAGDRFAIIIGCNNYPKDPEQFSTLRSAENDAKGVRDILVDKCNFNNENIKLFTSEAHWEILREINMRLKQVQSNDFVLIYFSGHGKLDEENMVHLAVSNTEVRALDATSLPVSSIKYYIDKSSTNRVVLILDCCYSGALGRLFSKGSVDDALRVAAKEGKGKYMLTASTGIQVAHEKEGEEYSNFTKYFIEGLKTGNADLDNDGKITVDELYTYVHAKVKEDNFQEPMKFAFGVQGDIVLADKVRKHLEKMIAPKVFKVFEEEIIPKGSEYKWVDRKTREPKPSWNDLTDKRIAVPHYFFDHVLEYLDQKHFCIVVGDKDTGKTWISYVSSHNFVKQGKEVRFATVDEDFDAEDAWNEIETQKLRGNGKPEKYFVVEDCHKNPTESEEFFQKVLDEGEENLRFLFTMRKTGKLLLEDAEPDIFYDEGTERKYIVPLLPDKMITEHVQNIIKRFIEVKEIEYEDLEKELEDVAHKWGNDLYWVWLRLNSWRYDEDQKLSNITDDQVYDSIWSDRYEIKLSLMKRRNILLPIAAVCQFEPLKVAESFLRWQDIDEGVLKELKEEGIIQISGKRYDFLSIKESFADIILSCVLRKDPFFKENYSTKENYTIQIVKNYLMQKPSNPVDVFSALYSAREAEKAISAKQILGSLLDDAYVWAVVKENVKDVSLGQMISLLDSSLWAEGKKLWMKSEKVSEIRSCYIGQNYKIMQDKLRSSSACTIRRYLPLLARIVTLERFFSVFSISDYKHIINSSTINTIRLLFIDFKVWELYSAAKTMIEALLDADLARLVQESASLYRIGGLIKEVKEADASAATKFVEKLSEIDLNELFSRNDPDAERAGLTKERVVDYFLRKRIWFALPHGGKIVNKIKDDVWNSLIFSASPKDGFWLLWHIYINSEDKAKHLVQNNIGQFLLKTCDDEFFRMALIGLLHLCDFEIKNIRLPKIDVRGLLENELHKEKPSNTRIVLSLIALRVKLPPTSFQFFDIIKYTKERVNSIPYNPQLKELLQKLIDIHL